MSSKGFTMVEVLVALTLGAMVMAILVPAFSSILAQSRVDAAARRFVSDAREARGRALSTGWEFRIVGYSSDAPGEFAGQYRVIGRRGTAVAWPDEDDEPFESNTQVVERWFSVADEFSGVAFDGAADRFELTFDSRGAAPGAATTFNPLGIDGKNYSKTITVSVVGGVSIQ